MTQRINQTTSQEQIAERLAARVTRSDTAIRVAIGLLQNRFPHEALKLLLLVEAENRIESDRYKK